MTLFGELTIASAARKETPAGGTRQCGHRELGRAGRGHARSGEARATARGQFLNDCQGHNTIAFSERSSRGFSTDIGSHVEAPKSPPTLALGDICTQPGPGHVLFPQLLSQKKPVPLHSLVLGREHKACLDFKATLYSSEVYSPSACVCVSLCVQGVVVMENE